MIIATPEVTPVTTPVPEPTKTVVLPELQVPPPTSVSAVEEPTQIVDIPLMAVGLGLTVTIAVAVQPKGNE